MFLISSTNPSNSMGDADDSIWYSQIWQVLTVAINEHNSTFHFVNTCVYWDSIQGPTSFFLNIKDLFLLIFILTVPAITLPFTLGSFIRVNQNNSMRPQCFIAELHCRLSFLLQMFSLHKLWTNWPLFQTSYYIFRHPQSWTNIISPILSFSIEVPFSYVLLYPKHLNPKIFLLENAFQNNWIIQKRLNKFNTPKRL